MPLACLEQIHQAHAVATRQLLLKWVQIESYPQQQQVIVDVLGHWRTDPAEVGAALLSLARPLTVTPELAESYYSALARLACHAKELREQTQNLLSTALPTPSAAVALARLMQVDQQKVETLLPVLTQFLPDPALCLTALLEAGMDDDIWADNYHGSLAKAISQHIQEHAQASLMSYLLTR